MSGNWSDNLDERLLDVVRELARELHPHRRLDERVELDAALDRDLGFDSLSRVELMMRLEKSFGVSLPEQLLASAETPRDLLRAIGSASPSGRVRERKPARPRPDAGTDISKRPDEAGTLTEVLAWHVERHADRAHVTLYESWDQPVELSYADLDRGSRGVAAGLRAEGLEPGQPVAIMLPTGRDYLFSFFGILMAGGVPVPIYPPVRPSQIEDHLKRQTGVLTNAQTPILITVPEARQVARLLRARVPDLRLVTTRSDLADGADRLSLPSLGGSDTAFLQYTSGSTGEPKGVVLSHDDLLANIRIMGDTVQVSGEDRFVSWLPLYHDMGLIGAWLGSLYYGLPLVLMSPLAFLARPSRWLWAIHEHGGTLSAAPNFAYELCLTKIDEEELHGLDLSSLRIAFNGAEPISPATLERFCERFGDHGFRREAMTPVYGLAEAAVGLAFPPLGRGPQVDRVDRQVFTREGRAEPAEEGDETALEFVACGQPLPGYEIRCVDEAGREVPERHEGRIQFRGPSGTSGYYRNPDATRELFVDGWLDTGDLGYIAGGDIHVTSRVKDLIIRAGRNIYPYEVEEAIGDIEGVRKGCVAVFGTPDPESGTERVVVVAETREKDDQRKAELAENVNRTATDVLGLAPDDVVMAPPGTVLKTSSGKIRRSAVRDLYDRNRIGKAPRAVWWQAVRVAVGALKPGLRSLRRRSGAFVYAARVQVVFWLLFPFGWLGAVLLPRLEWRWGCVHYGARLLFRLCGTPLRVSGLDKLPDDGPCVITPNHSSYLDGVALAAAFRQPVSFVAKAELAPQFFAGRFLKGLNARFVERFDRRKSLDDARAAAGTLKAGGRLLTFPEGTLIRAPGLLTFHMGPFVTAAEAGAPVVPVVIRGTRSILRSGSWFPRRGMVSLQVLEPVEPGGSDWEHAVELRDAAREAILEHLGEPDLAGERPAIHGEGLEPNQ